MKLLTLNTHSWREENQQQKITALAKAIVEGKYDVIAFQEVNQRVEAAVVDENGLKEDNFMLAVKAEVEKLGGPVYEGCWKMSKVVRGEFEEGSSIMSRYPITAVDCFPVTQNTSIEELKTRRIIKASINYKGKIVDIYSCHLGWWHDEIEPFEYQIQQFTNHIDSSRFALFMGDFNNNANIREEGYDYLLAQGFKDTYTAAQEKDSGITVQGEISGWKGNEGGLRIDLILTNQPVEVKTSRVIFNGINKAVVSDHYGVEAEIIY